MILFIETNFLMAVATGRAPHAEALLATDPGRLQIVLPTICVMEAWSVFEAIQKRRRRFSSEIEQQTGELRRDRTSPHAADLLEHLDRARLSNDDLLNDIKRRLIDVTHRLTVGGRATLIETTAISVKRSLNDTLIEDRTDSLILHTILAHAPPNPGAVFLSENTSDFGAPEVKHLLQAAGILYVETSAQVRGRLGGETG